VKQNKLIAIDSFLISFILHVGLLTTLAFITLKLPRQVSELTVEWLTDTRQEIVQEDFAPRGEVQSSDNSQSNTADNNVISEQNPAIEKVSAQPTVAKSIEPPLSKPNSNVNSAPVPGVSSTYLSGIKSKLQGSASQSGSGYQLDNADGNIAVLKQVLPKPDINDYGKVTLQFKINRDGTVDSESIFPVQIDDPNYTNESIAALKQWVFSYKSYISSKVYRISFIFKPE
jgi:hypothetical protein